MPTTVGQVTFYVVLIAISLVLSHMALRRWGYETTGDPVVVLWRRWAELGRRPHEEKPLPLTTRARAMASDDGEKLARATGGLDHVPLEPIPSAGPLDAPAEPKVALRHRFRRGLAKTRDVLGRDVREVFGRGPTDEAFDALEEALVAADVGVGVATALTEDMRARRTELTSETLSAALAELMVARLAGADRRLQLNRDGLSVWVVCGVNGTGKTTSIAKLASRAKRLGVKVCLAAADTFRAAAVEQLEEWGRRLDIEVVRQSAGADPGAVVFDAIAHARAQELDLVIVDTAGRLHTRKPLMDELAKVVRVIEREGAAITECLLVVDATTGQNGIVQAKAFGEAVGVTGLVLAKLDGTAKGGIAFAVEDELGVPVKAIGTGESHNDLVPFEPSAFVDALLAVD